MGYDNVMGSQGRTRGSPFGQLHLCILGCCYGQQNAPSSKDLKCLDLSLLIIYELSRQIFLRKRRVMKAFQLMLHVVTQKYSNAHKAALYVLSSSFSLYDEQFHVQVVAMSRVHPKMSKRIMKILYVAVQCFVTVTFVTERVFDILIDRVFCLNLLVHTASRATPSWFLRAMWTVFFFKLLYPVELCRVTWLGYFGGNASKPSMVCQASFVAYNYY